MCKAPACLYALPTTSGHATDEAADGVLGELLPDLDQGISELLESLWLYLVVSDAPVHNVPLVGSIGFRSGEQGDQVNGQPRSDNSSEVFIPVSDSSQGPLAMMCRSVRSSKDMSPQAITAIPPNRSYWMILQAA